MKFRQSLLVVLVVPLLVNCGSEPTLLEKIKHEGELRVLTRPGPTTFYKASDSYGGVEFELASLFAQHLGVALVMTPETDVRTIYSKLANGEAHLAAAGLIKDPSRSDKIAYGSAYQWVRPQLVYRYNHNRANSLQQAAASQVEVHRHSVHARLLRAKQQAIPDLVWDESKRTPFELLERVWLGQLDYTIANDNDIEVGLKVFPELRVAETLSEPVPLAWAFKQNEDASLLREAVKFTEYLKETRQLDQIVDRYYAGHHEFDYVGTKRFLRHTRSRLPKYEKIFIEAATQYQLPWQLLAAMGYQESHWNPKAVSPTGVRGIMMLTRKTAFDMGFENRIKPENSIFGGAKYFKRIKRQISDQVLEPDRTWLALAAYNVGIGHVEDAQDLTATLGGDPNKWIDVRKHLPLLKQEKWYTDTKYGKARGDEAVLYVENIRTYHDILLATTNTDSKWRDNTKEITITPNDIVPVSMQKISGLDKRFLDIKESPITYIQ